MSIKIIKLVCYPCWRFFSPAILLPVITHCYLSNSISFFLCHVPGVCLLYMNTSIDQEWPTALCLYLSIVTLDQRIKCKNILKEMRWILSKFLKDKHRAKITDLLCFIFFYIDSQNAVEFVCVCIIQPKTKFVFVF